MEDKEYNKKRSELMNEHWTEELHYGLKDLDKKDAKRIVDSMTDVEIWTKVNIRRFQEDYIADYLLYLWEISKTAFWKQIKVTFDDKEGMLWGADMMHYEILCKNEIPDDVFTAILKYALNQNGHIEQNENAIFCIINSQINKYDKLENIQNYIKNLKGKEQEFANKILEKGMKLRCNYIFC